MPYLQALAAAVGRAVLRDSGLRRSGLQSVEGVSVPPDRPAVRGRAARSEPGCAAAPAERVWNRRHVRRRDRSRGSRSGSRTSSRWVFERAGATVSAAARAAGLVSARELTGGSAWRSRRPCATRRRRGFHASNSGRRQPPDSVPGAVVPRVGGGVRSYGLLLSPAGRRRTGARRIQPAVRMGRAAAATATVTNG